MTNIDQVLECTRVLHNTNIFFREVAPWPNDLKKILRPRTQIPATELVKNFPLCGNKETHQLVNIIRKTTLLTNWQRTYTEEEVGSDFLNRYGYYELIGPKGHFYSKTLRAFIVYWGEQLTYDWHSHEAEEIYLVLAGSGLFKTKGKQTILKANDYCFHRSWQSHSMITSSEPIITLVLWFGKGIQDMSKMDQG